MTDEHLAERPQSGASRAQLVAASAVGVFLCAVIGALGGYVLAVAGDDDPGYREGLSGPTAPATDSANPPDDRSTETRTKQPPKTPKAPIGQIILPDLAGEDFEDARAELRKLGLGVHVQFGDSGNDRSVGRTEPPAGSQVKKGVTVKLFVRGGPPEVRVPDLIGETCRQAAKRVVEEGLSPLYPTGNNGHVLRQDPEPDSTTYWNEQIRLYCGEEDGATSPPED